MSEPEAAEERTEQELRALLERAVPQLPAPAQRLEGVRERVRRRRGRRTAAATGGAVLALAAGLVAVPGLVRPDGGGREAPAVVGSATPRPGPVLTTPPSGYRPGGMGGLVLQMPTGAAWKTFADPATTSLFLSTQRMVLPEGGCGHALDGFCTPLALALKKDGVLVMFRRQKLKMPPDKAHMYEVPLAEAPPYQACRTVGGTRQLSRTMVAPDGTVVWTVACLDDPSRTRVQEARHLLDSAAFG